MNDELNFSPNVSFFAEAEEDYWNLDRSVRIIVAKAINKVASNPKPNYEGGYGKPLSGILSDCLKIKLKASGLRIVYKYQRHKDGMEIIVISMRDDKKVYKIAAKRLNK